MEDYELNDREYTLFRDLVYRLTGIVISEGKRQLLKSRLQRRLRHHNLISYQQYYDLVIAQGENSPEITEMINCITTNKTDFYREPHHFEYISKTVMPEIVARVKRGEAPAHIRVWHAGCSTGEEPYTLAITLAEALEGKGTWDVRQLASDIDTNVLAHAERGVYELERIAPVPKALIPKYFLRGKGSQQNYVKVRPELRDRIAFRQINLLADSWPINPNVRFDMLFCRNVIIYFDKATQRRLLERFTHYIRPGGYLFLGHSESLLGVSEAFDSVGQTIHRLPDRSRAKVVAA